MVLGASHWLTSALERKWAFWPGQNMLKTSGRPDPNQLPFPSSAYKPSGAIKPPPVIMPFGVLRVLSVTITFIYFGTYISKSLVNFLEEKSLFPLDFEDDDYF